MSTSNSNSITPAEVAALARLAGIQLSEAEQAALAPQIAGFSAAVGQLRVPLETEPAPIFVAGGKGASK